MLEDSLLKVPDRPKSELSRSRLTLNQSSHARPVEEEEDHIEEEFMRLLTKKKDPQERPGSDANQPSIDFMDGSSSQALASSQVASVNLNEKQPVVPEQSGKSAEPPSEKREETKEDKPQERKEEPNAEVDPKPQAPDEQAVPQNPATDIEEPPADLPCEPSDEPETDQPPGKATPAEPSENSAQQ